MEVHCIEGTGYTVLSLGYIVNGFKSRGCLVSRVLGTWFWRYWGKRYIVSNYPQ